MHRSPSEIHSVMMELLSDEELSAIPVVIESDPWILSDESDSADPGDWTVTDDDNARDTGSREWFGPGVWIDWKRA